MATGSEPRSLIGRTLVTVALRIGIVVALATVLGYWHVRSGLEKQALVQLEEYVEQRRVRESAVFVLAADQLETFAGAYRAGLAAPPSLMTQARFDQLFERRADGTVRVRQHWFERTGITGYIGKFVDIDGDLRRRLVVAFDVLLQFGPAWRDRFDNLYVVTPENAVLMFWPDLPWALDASDWEINGKLQLASAPDDHIETTQPARPPLDGLRWSELYFDYGINDWMVSATAPVVDQGRHLLAVGHDILLADLFERTLASKPVGTYNVIFRDDGRLIAHPRFMEAIQASSGALSIQEAGDPTLERVFRLATGRPDDRVVIENDRDSAFLAVTRLGGPGWYLVTVFPEAIIASQAWETARLILLLGIVALAVEIGILCSVLRNNVNRPLHHLIDATRRMAAGRFDSRLDAERPDELGELAQAFNHMAGEIVARESALSERSAALAKANRQLGLELEERERAEREIARQREALHQSEKLNALGTLLAGVAHELNNPLSVVVARSMLLEEAKLDPRTESSVRKIRLAAERCARIVRTFLAMARQQSTTRVPVRLDRLLESALELLGYGLRSSGVDVTCDIAEELPETLADADQITQVLTNLIVNAQQALADVDGPRRLRIALDHVRQRDVLRIVVEDSGPGIPEEIRSRIFEPFFTTKPTGAGTGVGLAVCRGIVAGHDGTIEAGSAALGGARFTVTLPVRRAPPEPAAQGNGRDDRPVPLKRILIVDDEEDVAASLRDILSGKGHDVVIAHGGKDALERLAESRFDLIVSDLVMPDLDGPALYRELERRHPELVPAMLFVTGDTLSPAARRFLEGRQPSVIHKPFEPEEVRRTVMKRLAGG